MTLQELQKQVLQLPTSQRWQLVHTLLESLQQEIQPVSKKGTCLDCVVLLKMPISPVMKI